MATLVYSTKDIKFSNHGYKSKKPNPITILNKVVINNQPVRQCSKVIIRNGKSIVVETINMVSRKQSNDQILTGLVALKRLEEICNKHFN